VGRREVEARGVHGRELLHKLLLSHRRQVVR
jgi:hypothetical protein